MLKLNLVPRERLSNNLFSRPVQPVREALAELGGSLNDDRSHHAVLRELEHRCDDVTREIYNLTNRTFVPPFERADILMLARSLDEIVGLAEEAADKIDLYHVESITDAAKSMGCCLAEAGSQIASAADQLVDGKDLVEVLEDIHRLENEGDHITRQALQRLFETNHRTAAYLIKW